jgi:lipoate-protein ligase A
MKTFDFTLPAPAENLACDELLLTRCGEGAGGEILRFWEPREPFVVVGYANQVAREVNVQACADRGIPIFRRCSGGGTVVQGPGCLNYSLILKIHESGTETIASTNALVMERNRAAVESLLGTPVLVRGHTDLAAGDLKFSGNAQRRLRRTLIFHGTFLLAFDLNLIGELLPMPSQQPDYRGGRPHAEFLMNLKVEAAALKQALKEAWQAHEHLQDFPIRQVADLAAAKYSTAAWNRKF